MKRRYKNEPWRVYYWQYDPDDDVTIGYFETEEQAKEWVAKSRVPSMYSIEYVK